MGITMGVTPLQGVLILWLLYCSSVLAVRVVANDDPRYEQSTWNCTTLLRTPLASDASNMPVVVWERYNCTGHGPRFWDLPIGGRLTGDSDLSRVPRPKQWKVGPMVFNVIRANLSVAGVQVRPAAASRSAPNMLQVRLRSMYHSIIQFESNRFWVESVCA